MKVADVSFSYDEKILTEEQLILQHYTITGWAEALQKQGVEVIVMKRFSKTNSLKKNGIQNFFCKDNLPGMPKPWHVPFAFLWHIKKLNVDVVHVHGFMFPLQTFFLRFFLNKKTGIVVQDHHGKPSKSLKSYVYGLLNNVADGYFFTSSQQAKEWLQLKNRFHKIMPVVEGANLFNYNSRTLAREKTGMKGNPIFIWVGRLNTTKDPLTVIDGFAIILKKYPSAKLYMVYGNEILLDDVKKKINTSEALMQAVFLLGKIEHDTLEDYYNSADYFVLGSYREGSGYALSEAMACGCIPIVTNIPSFTVMTNNGKLGALWQPGNSQSFAEAAMLAMSKNMEVESQLCVDFFKTNLSYDAIATTAIGHYKKIIKHRNKS